MRNRVLLLTVLCLALGTVAAQETFILAAENDWYPYSADRNGMAVGLSTEIIAAAYKAAGANLVLELMPFKRGMELAKNGVYVGVFNTNDEPYIRAAYHIPEHFLAVSEQVVYGRIGRPDFTGAGSMQGKKLGVTLGYTYPDEIMDDPLIKKESTGSDISNLRKLALGRIDFFIVDKLVSLSLISENRAELEGKFIEVGKLSSVNLIPVFSKNDAGRHAMEVFDRGMDLIRASGKYEQILNAWLLH